MTITFEDDTIYDGDRLAQYGGGGWRCCERDHVRRWFETGVDALSWVEGGRDGCAYAIVGPLSIANNYRRHAAPCSREDLLAALPWPRDQEEIEAAEEKRRRAADMYAEMLAEECRRVFRRREIFLGDMHSPDGWVVVTGRRGAILGHVHIGCGAIRRRA